MLLMDAGWILMLQKMILDDIGVVDGCWMDIDATEDDVG